MYMGYRPIADASILVYNYKHSNLLAATAYARVTELQSEVFT